MEAGSGQCVQGDIGNREGCVTPDASLECGGTSEAGQQQQVEYIFSSMKRRGNRNKAMLLKEKREQLKEKRTNGYKRCGRVSSNQVPKELIQDRSKAMVVIGSDAVSLFPSLTKQESADEAAEAVLESDMKWEGINWKEAVRFLVLGRDEAWCRSSKLRKILPWRKSNKGTRPGLKGVGPLGAEVNDEKQWNFPQPDPI